MDKEENYFGIKKGLVQFTCIEILQTIFMYYQNNGKEFDILT